MDTTAQTLADRLTSERMPVTEALRVGMSLADRLREVHDQGGVHGALTPSAIAICGDTVQLLTPEEPAAVTPYTAPEIVEGRPADARSDIFSLGAIFYEMLTGGPPFQSASPADLDQAIAPATPRPTGSPAVDRLLNDCLAKSPDSRFQRVQKLKIELRLLSSAARRGAASPVPPPVAALAPATQPRHALADSSEMLDGHSLARLENAVKMLADRLSRLDLLVSTAVERLQKVEASLDAFDTDAAALRDSVAQDIRNFERALKTQNAAIESARTAMGQTDDLVERVVEALDPIADLTGFGAVLYAMLEGKKPDSDEFRLVPAKPAGLKGATGLRAAAIRLAELCLAAERDSPPDFQKILTEVRLLNVIAKQHGVDHVVSAPAAFPPPQTLAVFAGKATPVIHPPVAPPPAAALPDPEKQEEQAPPPADPSKPGDDSPATKRALGSHSRPVMLDVACPKCKGFHIRLSRPRTAFERFLNILGIGIHRCHRCFYRYVPLLGRKMAGKAD